MTHYEQILDKIAPTFYKLAQYNEYFEKSQLLVHSYLASIKLFPIMLSLYLPKKSNYYYFYIKYIPHYYPFLKKIVYKQTTMLVTNDKIEDATNVIQLDELIVNMIINGFSAENEREIVEFNDYHINPTNTFIALVGRDLYETLRASIR